MKTPKHYKTKIQPIDIWDDWKLDPFTANSLKYIARAGKKDGESKIKDINKAIHYLEIFRDKLIKRYLKKAKKKLNKSDDTAYCWIEIVRPWLAEKLVISEKEVEKKYYNKFFN